MLNIVASCFNATVCFCPSSYCGLAGVEFRRVFVRYNDACISASTDAGLGKVVTERNKFVVSETLSTYVLTVYAARKR